MALDTYSDIWNRVILRCPALSPKLAQDLTRNAFRRLAERRRWSWLVKFGQFIAPTPVTAGTVSVTQNSTIVTGVGTTWTNALQGQQFRIGLTNPIYTVANVDNSTQLELDSIWGGITATTQPYQIYQAFYTPPQDFHQFICLWDPAFNWQLYLDTQQSEINIWDAQRANIGNAYVVSFRDYTTAQQGTVGPVVQIFGIGAVPTASGPYTSPIDGFFNIIITTGGTSGTAQFQWAMSGSQYQTLVTDPNGAPQTLQNGVSVAFPTGATYNVSDQFVIQCQAVAQAGLPRYELWPHQQANHVYPFLYESRPPDLSDAGAVLPRYIRGDVLTDMAMEEVCSWPGPSLDKPNPYFSMQAAERYRMVNERQINLLEVQDDNVWEQDLGIQYPAMAWAMATPLGDASFLQSHAI